MEKKRFPPRRSVIGDEADKEMIYGLQPVLEAIEAGKDIDRLYVSRTATGGPFADLLQKATALRIPVYRVPQEKLQRMTAKNHQGVIAYASVVEYASLDGVVSQAFESGQTPLILILDRITDVRNFGAIARTAECAGVHGIVIPAKGAAQISGDALRTSAGALAYIPVCREGSLKQVVRYLKQSGLQVVACTEKTQSTIYQADLSTPTAIIMGAEDTGISDDLLREADTLASIPMGGRIGSLNVSVACGVVLFEALRQQKTGK